MFRQIQQISGSNAMFSWLYHSISHWENCIHLKKKIKNGMGWKTEMYIQYNKNLCVWSMFDSFGSVLHNMRIYVWHETIHVPESTW